MYFNIFPALTKKNNAIALRHKNIFISYSDLTKQLDKISGEIDFKACPQIIAIFMERSIELVFAMLSCFFSEHIFCILDANMPAEKLCDAMEELGTNLLFTNEKHYSKYGSIIDKNKCNAVIFNFEEESEKIGIIKKGNHRRRGTFIDNLDCSHIVYTSGSTGRAKGILSSRRATLNFIKWEKAYLEINEPVNIAQMSTPWFDPYMRDVFLAISTGGTICIPTQREYFDPSAFFDFCTEKNISLIHIVPTLFRQLFLSNRNDKIHNIKYILLAGEMSFGCDIKKYYEKNKTGMLFNLYGPSETTLAKFCYKISSEDAELDRIPVGKPIDDTFFRIIDENGKELSAGDIGEVIIYTKDCSYGYLNRPELNGKVFDKQSCYVSFRTSDTGFVRDDGNLELVGRIDNMKKIYGQKVFPEEIEGVLMACPGIRKCRCDISNNQIVAYIEASVDFDVALYRSTVSVLVPFKRPHKLLIMEKIPTNKNGKIDRTVRIEDEKIKRKLIL